jgi:exopolysaccharide production protein ExoQ
MAPIAALLICVLFILVLLRLDRPAPSAVSAGLWVPTIWVLIVGSRMVSLWFPSSQSLRSLETYEDGSPLDRAVFLCLIAAAAFILIKRRVRLTSVVRANVWLVTFLVFCGLSIVWSDFPLVSLKRYIKNIGNVLMVLVVLTDRDATRALVTLGKRCAYILIPLSIVLYKYYPEFGREYNRWTGALLVTGVTNNKNSLGALAAACGLFLVWALLLHRRRSGAEENRRRQALIVVGVLLMTLWTLVRSNSATALVCFGVGSVVLLVGSFRRTHKGLLVAVCLMLVCIAALVEVASGSIIETLLRHLGRDATFTGRTDLWADIVAISPHYLGGVGFGAFWLGPRMAVRGWQCCGTSTGGNPLRLTMDIWKSTWSLGPSGCFYSEPSCSVRFGVIVRCSIGGRTAAGFGWLY